MLVHRTVEMKQPHTMAAPCKKESSPYTWETAEMKAAASGNPEPSHINGENDPRKPFRRRPRVPSLYTWRNLTGQRRQHLGIGAFPIYMEKPLSLSFGGFDMPCLPHAHGGRRAPRRPCRGE